MVIEKNKVAVISYSLEDTDGNILDSSKENGDLPYLHGSQFLAPGIEKSLEGKKVGDSVDEIIAAAEAFGDYREDLVFSVKKSDINIEESMLEAGLEFEAEIKGEVRYCNIQEVNGDSVVVNANHPLSGIDIHFQAEVLSIRDATAEEIDHGHAHGEDGQHHNH